VVIFLALDFQTALTVIVHALTIIASLVSLQGARQVEYETIFADGDEKKDAKSLNLSLKLNEAACRLKLNSFPEVVDLTTKVNS
jgi:hypothetical protein